LFTQLTINLQSEGTENMQLIRTMVVAGSLLLGGAASATAADLGGGMKDDVVSYSPLWQGRYMGVNIGASAAGIDVAGVGKDDEADVTSSGFSGGVLIGYNFRNGPWVGGFEADINGVAADETKDVTGLGRVTLSSSANASLRVRGGYAWNSVFLYATGGLGITHYSVKSSLGGKEELIAGTPVLGLGAEFAIDQNWTMRAEALAYGGCGEDITLAGAKHDVDFGYSTVRVGLTRRF
jgi:outer membrane immunogenic protein